MPSIENDLNYISKLKKIIADGTQLILMEYKSVKLLKLISEELGKRNICNVEVWHCIMDVPCFEHTKLVSQEQMNKTLKLYQLYCFSDKVTVVSDAFQHGNLLNYVKNNIITEEELVAALIHKYE